MTKKEISFENALEELQSIISKLEEAHVGLDDALKYYERGIELVRFCNNRLSEAQIKVDLLHLREDGNLSTEPFVGE